MATGINKHEKIGDDAKIAARPHVDPIPLPSKDAVIQLSYQGKANINDVFAPVELGFSKIVKNKFAKIERIKPNSFVLSDNLFVLHDMIESNTKATLVYMDPPYGTGMEFQSRSLEHAYKDNMYPAVYLEYIRRRLILIREILSDDGSIYIHIGHQMLAHLKVLMDEVFGAKNFRNIITRRKCSSKNFTKNQYSNIHDYILFYSKGPDYKWNKPGIKADEEWIDKEYLKVDQKGRFKLVPVHAPGTRNGETGKEWRGKQPPPGKHWQYSPAKLDELDEKGEIHWSCNGNPRRKVYLTKDKMLPLTDYWPQYRDAHHQSIKVTGYPTEKNFEMLKMIVGASSDPGDLVIDPFVGSGTTIHAAHELNRKWIGIDQSFTAADSLFKRFGEGFNAMGDYVSDKKQLKDVSSENITPIHKPTKSFDFIVDNWLIDCYEDELFGLHSLYLRSR